MDLTGMISAGGAHPGVLFVFALALGALHGLEPGHSKTMMAAYIIASKGTVHQAIVLGISAAVSHSLIVWVLAGLALSYGNALIGEELEPWFMMVSGVLVIGIGLWMLRQQVQSRAQTLAHAHVHAGAGHCHNHDHPHSHAHAHGEDTHARAHAADIERRLVDGRTSTWQTILFGFSGGLIPCPAAITVFLLCLHLGQVTLGIVLVSAFSLGLAATLVLVGVIAALGLSAVRQRSGHLDAVFAAAPYLSGALICLVGAVILWSGWHHLAHPHHL